MWVELFLSSGWSVASCTLNIIKPLPLGFWIAHDYLEVNES